MATKEYTLSVDEETGELRINGHLFGGRCRLVGNPSGALTVFPNEHESGTFFLGGRVFFGAVLQQPSDDTPTQVEVPNPHQEKADDEEVLMNVTAQTFEALRDGAASLKDDVGELRSVLTTPPAAPELSRLRDVLERVQTVDLVPLDVPPPPPPCPYGLGKELEKVPVVKRVPLDDDDDESGACTDDGYDC